MAMGNIDNSGEQPHDTILLVDESEESHNIGEELHRSGIPHQIDHDLGRDRTLQRPAVWFGVGGQYRLLQGVRAIRQGFLERFTIPSSH